ncbi:MAG: hypothetical protein PHT32_06465 [Candidatus Omnitrophica bacterium]|nr:hypothetical protein [Candidatus Omnitrophota bacterium]
MPATDLFPEAMLLDIRRPIPRDLLANVKTARCGKQNWHRCDMGNADCPFRCVKAEPALVLPDLNTNMDIVEEAKC